MSQADQRLLSRRATDDQGRVLPISQEERQARFETLSRTLDHLGDYSDASDDDESWKDFYRSIDEGRPERKLFEGMY